MFDILYDEIGLYLLLLARINPLVCSHAPVLFAFASPLQTELINKLMLFPALLVAGTLRKGETIQLSVSLSSSLFSLQEEKVNIL